MARLSFVEREQLPEDQRRFWDAVKEIRRGSITGPFIVAMNSSPDLAARVAHLGNYFHHRGQADESILSVRVRTWMAAILSRELDGVYEWGAWSGQAIAAGVPEAAVNAVRDRKQPTGITEEDQIVYDACKQIMTGAHRLSEATYQAALAHFGKQGLVELVACLGYFSAIAIPLNVFEIAPRPGAAELPI